MGVSRLLGEAPLWDRFWDNPRLSDAERDILLAFRDRARRVLAAEGDGRDFGLIHADLVPTNVIVDQGEIRLIDFDDGGFGYRLFDVATALLKISDRPDYPELKAALIGGYRAERALDMGELPLFMALRAVTYVGWNITRMSEADGVARDARFISAAMTWVRAVLEPL